MSGYGLTERNRSITFNLNNVHAASVLQAVHLSSAGAAVAYATIRLGASRLPPRIP